MSIPQDHSILLNIFAKFPDNKMIQAFAKIVREGRVGEETIEKIYKTTYTILMMHKEQVKQQKMQQGTVQ